MTLQSTFWVQAKRAFAHLLGGDAKALAQLSAIMEAIAASPIAEQHQPASELFSLMGRLPNAREQGFLLGRQIPVTAYGDLALGLKIAPTFGDALRLMVKHHHRLVPLALYAFKETQAEGRFTIGFRCPIDKDGEAFLMSAVVAMFEREVGRMTGQGASLKALELTAGSAGWEQAYRRQGFVMPTVGHGSNTVVIDRAVLDHPNPIADVDTFNCVVSEFEQRVLLEDPGTSAAVRMRELVMSNIANPPGLDGVAATMHLTRRQLRLALTRDGTSYQEVVKSCRVEYASALFRNPALSISQIAYRLGYSDVSAFTHTFTRWTGKSPSRFRIEMLL